MLTYGEIDAKIEALSKEILALRSFRNTLNPITRLPCDILIRIFFLLQAASADGAWAGSSSIPKDHRWIIATHVCRQWREFALDCRTLWSKISSDNPLADVWLTRSGNSVLSVQVEHWCHINPGNKTTRILQELHRIRSLSLDGCQDAWKELEPLLVQGAPALQTLSINSNEESLDAHYPLIISSDIFSNNTPELRSVTLGRCQFELNCTIFKTLTRLRIEYPQQKISPVDIITTLKAMPHLEALFLIGAIQASPDSEPMDQLAIVDLTSLVEFFLLELDYDDAMTILSHTAFHPRAVVEVEFNMPQTGLDAVSTLLHTDAQCRRTPSLPTSSELVLEVDCDTQKGVTIVFQLPNCPPHLNITIPAADTAGLLEIQAQFGQLPLTNLVAVESYEAMDPTIWRNELAHLPHLRSIVLLPEGSTAFLQFLHEWFSAPNNATVASEESADILPALTLLYIAHEDEEYATGLIAYLESRAKRGRKLERLFLSPSFFNSCLSPDLRVRVRSSVGWIKRVSDEGIIKDDIDANEDILDDDSV